ncbi:MAG: hypothetical protein ABJN39_09370 [Sulfitobacter sp.]|uniref:hypothetical protein n=2 Tax=Pseudomonadota TaxID=1224 RepID=UPI0029438C98|nr:hypothetical protein [Sulfitobacter sp. LC.270.F.C4]WOI13513.1 hypothetical protein R1T45_01770 [Sulfitobacter sp. LC.270.F.C4]
MTQTAIHVRHNVSGKIKRVQREGRETIILPSYAAKADTVLNNILYPKDELETSYAGLNRTPAPYGHPVLNGQFVPAKDPEAMARTSIFAWNENARWDGDRIALDVVIDEARAKESENGRKVLEAIANEQPIATSTGLLCNLEAATDKPYEGIARGIEWDHVAILLNETPAIAPEQGVGIFVNSAGKSEEVKVINSSLDDQLDQEIEWAVDSIARAIERKEEREENRPLLTRIKAAILEALGSEVQEPATNNRKDADMTDKTQFDDLSKRVNALTESAVTKEDLTNALTEAMKPLIDAQAEMTANAKAKAEADHAALVNKVVEAKIEGLGKDVAEKMDATALNALLTMHTAQNKKAAPLASGFMMNSEAEDDMSPLGWGAKQ